MTNALLIHAILLFVLVLFLCFLLYILAYSPELLRKLPLFRLHRAAENPVLAPHQRNDWESQGVFNPAAILDDEGMVHLLYRAMGDGGLSQIGHAQSEDSVHFERISPHPVYQPTYGYGLPEDVLVPQVFDPLNYASGGGWGGCEDPRAVVIGNRVYMTYTAFEGWNNARISLTSIALKDLQDGKWKWKRPIYLSPANEMHKNWVLFPEKINGKYAILHGLAPKVLIEYVNDLDFNKNIKSAPSHGGGGYTEPARAGEWDEKMRGAGAPPLRTDLGWLVLYHGMRHDDPHMHGIGYRVGAMILDINDPTKILYRSPEPILNPEMHYENDWKPGVVYASGALIIGDDLHVYYGGGDKYICKAHTSLTDLLSWLKEHGTVTS